MKGANILRTGLLLFSTIAGADVSTLPVYDESKVRVEADWLVHPVAKPVDVYRLIARKSFLPTA